MFKLGYYTQITFVRNDTGQVKIPNDLYLALNEFNKYCDEVVLFLNHADFVNRSLFDLPSKCRLVDIGKNQPMWKKMLGKGFEKEVFQSEVNKLNAIIIQGPTPLLYYLNKHIDHTKVDVFFLIVGMIRGAFPGQFRPYSYIKHIGIKVMVGLIEWQQRRAFRYGTVLANNHLNVEDFKKYCPAFLVSKSLMTAEDVDIKPFKPLNKKIRLLSYGRVEPDKHIETILRACAILKEKGIAFELQIVGDALAVYIQFLRKEIEKLALEKEVSIIGKVAFEEKKVYFHKADMFIFSTCGTEGFPRVIWEAFAFGTPVIAAEYPGATGFFTHKKELLLYKRKDEHALASHIVLLSKDENLRRKMLEEALILFLAHTREKGHQRMLDIIKNSGNAI